ncbi:transient receptor potential cation channel subfamily V member 3 isoform X2 [Protopterus annectens]|uniref:transient receptor potential cation channel subfamily V member 3 isoform X2 n=1 Tax=Protopterus annectens TaxID=7888 RepID=UPI001CFAC78A|nr:transient receptor potential cation channel subfamily V member 3 isoform X2 [Protopterus annectens]
MDSIVETRLDNIDSPSTPDNAVTIDTEPRNYRRRKNLRQQIFDAIAKGDAAETKAVLEKLALASKRYVDRNVTEFLLSKCTDHSNGKTCLMKALLNINDQTFNIVTELLQFGKKNKFLKELINAEYTDKFYKGQTALHIAIERRCQKIAEILIQEGANVNARATGLFFKPSNKENGFYFGETPLALAACTNQPEILKILMANSKTDVTFQDSQGNNVLHALVLSTSHAEKENKFIIDTYETIVMHAKDKTLEKMQNKEGLTPLKLAALHGKIGILKAIFRREIKNKECREISRKFTDWAYGPVSSSLYDLSEIDTFEENSLLEIIIYKTNAENRHEMLSLEPLNSLLQMKWKQFAAVMFSISFTLSLVFNIILTLLAYYGPQGASIETVLLQPSDLKSVLSDAWFHILFFIQALLVIVAVILFWFCISYHLIALVLALTLGWTNMLYYTRGFQSLGIYSVMIQKIILNDVSKFLFVYALFILGFAAALASLIQCPDQKVCSPYHNFSSALLELFKLTLGLGNLEMQKNSLYPAFSLLLLVLYVILTFVLLLNMLIAVMGETVENLARESKNIWKLQRARTILDLERTLPRFIKKRFLQGEMLNIHGVYKRYLRINEANWTEWNTNFELINEDPLMKTQRDTPIKKKLKTQRNKRQSSPSAANLDYDTDYDEYEDEEGGGGDDVFVAEQDNSSEDDEQDGFEQSLDSIPLCPLETNV